MKALTKLTWTEMKLYLREPVALFFTVAYAPLMLILFGSIYGNEPEALFGNRGTVDMSVPAYIALIIISVGLMSIPIAAATYREKGILRRFRATPLRPVVYMIANVLNYYLMTLIGMLMLVGVGKALYHVRFEGHILSVFAAFTLGTLSMFAFGFLLAGVAPSARFAQAVGMILAFPMMFLSGAAIPLQIMPENIQHIAQWIPLTYVVKLLQATWFGEGWGGLGQEVAILLAFLLVCTALATHFFRWE
ncbi:MAG: ABC transporter permease [Chloroflexi bacterium]|nr:ABC transporter permease [Chloroflexota bacterium]